ncbi:hypothetical protein [Chryseolinea lacunae]|nr:hypothetical protein [Chryseolinea lacunae]
MKRKNLPGVSEILFIVKGNYAMVTESIPAVTENISVNTPAVSIVIFTVPHVKKCHSIEVWFFFLEISLAFIETNFIFIVMEIITINTALASMGNVVHSIASLDILPLFFYVLRHFFCVA